MSDMSDLILHQYADSPFSEKIRALFGFKELAYLSVDIPAIMPKPDVTALTGGYRRTPIVQCGADIYCDTALIAELIEARKPNPSVFNTGKAGLEIAAARWVDTEFFRICVGLVFQPKALAANPRFKDTGAAEAFIKDRAAFTAGSAGLAVPLARAEAGFRTHLGALESTLSEHAFLGGDSPNITDFSNWHLCWFIYRQPALRYYFESFPKVLAWGDRMRVFSEAPMATTLSSSDAIARAASCEPRPIENPLIDPLVEFEPGTVVKVLPTDYGFQPVIGALLVVDDRHIVVARDDDRAGRVHVHFPRHGFDVSLAGDDQ